METCGTGMGCVQCRLCGWWQGTNQQERGSRQHWAGRGVGIFAVEGSVFVVVRAEGGDMLIAKGLEGNSVVGGLA